MSDFVPNPHVLPPDGFYFVDADNVKHTGSTWSELYKRVKEYRLQNGKPPGDPMTEVNDFTCKRYPQGCKELRKVYPTRVGGTTRIAAPSPTPRVVAMANKVVQWFYKVIRGSAGQTNFLASPQEAQRRAEICRRCPRQTPWTLDCGTCAGSAFRLATAIRQNRDVKNGDGLMACRVLGEDTRTSIHLERLKPVDSDDLPPECWRKAISK